MKSKILLTLIICCLGIYIGVQYVATKNTPAPLGMEIEEKSPIDLMFMQRAYPTGEIKPSAYCNAAAWRQDLQNTQRNQSNIWDLC